MAGCAGGTFTLKNRAEDQRSPRPAFSLSHDSVSPYRHTVARHQDPLGSDSGGEASGGQCPPQVPGAEGLPGPPLSAWCWTQLVAHDRPSAGSRSFPGVAGPPVPPPCSTGMAIPGDREGCPLPLHPGFTPILDIPAAPP